MNIKDKIKQWAEDKIVVLAGDPEISNRVRPYFVNFTLSWSITTEDRLLEARGNLNNSYDVSKLNEINKAKASLFNEFKTILSHFLRARWF